MRKKHLINALLILAILAVIGGSAAVIAYMFRQTDVELNEFTPAEVTCVVNEVFGNNQKSSITVQNTSNINAYLRVQLVAYWVKEDNQSVVAPKSSGTIPSFNLGEGWIKDPNTATYYYTKPVAPDAWTETSLIADGASIPLGGVDGCLQVIDVFAEAIQAEPTDAVKDSWGVTVENGEIKSVP